MRKILSTLLFLPALAMAEPDILNFQSYCVSFNKLAEVLEKHGEEPLMTFKSHRVDNGINKSYITVLFVNPKTRSFTIAEKFKDNYFCVTSVGSNMKPYIPAEDSEDM